MGEVLKGGGGACRWRGQATKGKPFFMEGVDSSVNHEGGSHFVILLP